MLDKETMKHVPKNKRKLTHAEQTLWDDVRHYFGKTNVAKLAELTGLSCSTLWRRYNFGGMTCLEYVTITNCIKEN